MNKYTIALLIMLVVYLGASLYALNPYLSGEGDNAQYMILAKSIVSGTGMREINNPSAPVHTKSPPGFPLMIAPIIAFFGYNVIALKIFMIVCSLALMIFLYLMFREYTHDSSALLLSAVTMFSFEVFHWTTEIMTEIPFMLFAVIAFYLYKKDRFWLMCIATIIATFIKTSGLMLVPAFFLAYMWRREYKKAMLLAVICAAPIVALSVYNGVMYPTSESYIQQVTHKNYYAPEQGYIDVPFIFERVMHSTYFYLGEIVMFFATYRSLLALIPFVGIFFVALMALGSIIKLKQNLEPMVTFMCLYMAVYLIWPWTSIRFIIVLAPFVFYTFITGIETLVAPKPDSKLLIAVVLLVMLVIQFPAFGNKVGEVRNWSYEDSIAKLNAMADWVKTHTNETDTFIVRSPYLFHIWSGRKTSNYQYTTDAGIMINLLVDYDYVVRDTYSSTTDVMLAPVLAANQDKFIKIFYIIDTELYKVNKSG